MFEYFREYEAEIYRIADAIPPDTGITLEILVNEAWVAIPDVLFGRIVDIGFVGRPIVNPFGNSAIE